MIRLVTPILRPLVVIAFCCVWLSTGSTTRAGTVYFKVAELPGQHVHNDSYILPLDDPADIAAARNIINQGPAKAKAHIAFASIAPGADGINQNLLSPFQTWSWHVTGFLGFAELGAELYDGWPSFVESDVDGWMDNTNGVIGFWGYTVVSEVVIPEPATWALGSLAGAGVALAGWRRRTAIANRQ